MASLTLPALTLRSSARRRRGGALGGGPQRLLITPPLILFALRAALAPGLGRRGDLLLRLLAI
eukprot:15353624-Alexandrium_andersonii.AAC.1